MWQINSPSNPPLQRASRSTLTATAPRSCFVLADAGHGVDTAFRGSAWFRRIMELKLGAQALEQAYRRMVFNIVGRFVSPAQAMPL